MSSISCYTRWLLAAPLLVACEQTPKSAEPESIIDFSYAGTVQNFTPLQFTSVAPDAQTYEWNFGDGTSSTEANPAHTFRRAGTYDVRLRTTGSGGPGDVTKTLTLAQADTAALIMGRIVGRYRFGKVIRIVSSFPNPQIVRRRPDTTVTVTASGPRSITLFGQQLDLTNSFSPWPVASRKVSHHRFSDVMVYFNWDAYFEYQGDSLIYTSMRSYHTGADETIYYGRKLP